MGEYDDDLPPWDDTTIGLGPVCIRECWMWQCPEDCPCGCDNCDGTTPVTRVDDIDPAGGVL